MKPSVARVVHYTSHGTPPQADGTQAYTSEPRAAIVTAVTSDTEVDLCVLNPTGLFFNQAVQYDGDDNPQGGTWHWPPRV